MKFHELATIIGEDAARALCEVYGGCQEKIPKVPPTERNAQIMRMFRKGVPRRVIADAFHLSYGHVCRIISEG